MLHLPQLSWGSSLEGSTGWEGGLGWRMEGGGKNVEQEEKVAKEPVCRTWMESVWEKGLWFLSQGLCHLMCHI